jgi:hypothetical protein
MRNYTNLSTKDIRLSMKRFKDLYEVLKQHGLYFKIKKILRVFIVNNNNLKLLKCLKKKTRYKSKF